MGSLGQMSCSIKTNLTFQPGKSVLEPNERAFDKANSGMIFQTAYL
jgi:hypothetical protein